MAEFVQTMKDWRRLCDAHTGDGDVCQRCPLGKVTNGCVAIYEDEMDYAGIEREVERWAAEHPEPVYPTWREWLLEMGVYRKRILCDGVAQIETDMLKECSPIPANIAEKLGLKPKEG